MNADLHSHSIVSDGLLSPLEMARRAHANGVELYALTDHDDVSGLTAARAEAESLGLKFVNGVEISVSWRSDHTIHILGFDFDAANSMLLDGLAKVHAGRDARAQLMSEELDKVGIHGAYEGALKYVSNPRLIGRSHFARFIVEAGHAKSVGAVFDHWLKKGKPGYVTHEWATLQQAVTWIRDAGGVAVIAHPGRYRISKKELRELVIEFVAAGGEGLEVLSGSQSQDQTREVARLTREFKLLASRGSDYHGPGQSWMDIGKMPVLPDDLTPVWNKFKCMNHGDTETQR